MKDRQREKIKKRRRAAVQNASTPAEDKKQRTVLRTLLLFGSVLVFTFIYFGSIEIAESFTINIPIIQIYSIAASVLVVLLVLLACLREKARRAWKENKTSEEEAEKHAVTYYKYDKAMKLFSAFEIGIALPLAIDIIILYFS